MFPAGLQLPNGPGMGRRKLDPNYAPFDVREAATMVQWMFMARGGARGGIGWAACSVDAWPTSPLRRIRQHEQIETGEEEQCKR